MSKTVVPEILDQLRPWLELRMTEWSSLDPGQRSPTLPHIGGKLDLRSVLRGAGIKAGHEQHFYRKAELQLEVNAAAERQGLRGINSRGEVKQDEKIVAERMSKALRDRSEYAKALAEAHALVERQRREIASLKARLQLRSETGLDIRIPSR